jgi:transcriptional regulator with XRE-family HTH domain
MAKTKYPANVVGKEIQKRRYALGLTQEQLAARCQLQGFDVSRGTLSQIEAQVRCVSDAELFRLAEILGVAADSLRPESMGRSRRQPKSPGKPNADKAG